MSFVYMDEYSHYGDITHLLDGVYASYSRMSLAKAPWDANDTLNVFSQNSPGFAAANELRRVLPTTVTKLYTSFHFALPNLPAYNGTNIILDWRTAGNSRIAAICIESDGSVSFRDGTSGSVLAATQGPVTKSKDFQLYEMCIDTVAGTFVLRVDDAAGTGTPVINASGLSLASAAIGQNGFLIQFGTLTNPTGYNAGGCPDLYLKDVTMRNSSGSVNNSFLGDLKVAALFADADTTTAGWTPRFYSEFGPGILNVTNPAGASVYAASSTGTDLGSGDFTIEGWFRWQSMPGASNYHTFMSKWDAVNNKRSWRFIYGGSSFNANNLQFDISTDGTSSGLVNIIQYPWIPDLFRWYHIALVRTSGQTLLFVDGNQLGIPIADAHTYYVGTEPTGIAGEFQGTNTFIGGTNFDGWLDDTRLTVGFARYTSAFTPSGPLPRGSGADAHWSNVAILAGYDNGIQDESSFVRTLNAVNGAFSQVVSDGSTIGSWSSLGVNKITPDDNTFLTAPYTAATGVLTMTLQPANNDTVTVGTKNGSTAAVYTFKTAIASAFDVLIDTTAQNTLLNLFNAINAGTGAGTKYGTSTTANFDVTAYQLPAGQLQMIANTLGTAGNSVATTSTSAHATWGGTTLSGGLNIPGPSDFKVQRPPPHTTVIAAVQLNTRMFKSDAGPCTVQPALIGPLGGVANGTAHPLTLSAVYYGDIIETDPDTAGPISPTTIVNGKLRLNRTA